MKRPIILTAALLLLLALPTPLMQQAAASDMPTASNVCGGDSHISHSSGTGTVQYGLRITGGTFVSACGTGSNYAEWARTTGTVSLTWSQLTSGVAPPAFPDGDAGDSCVAEVYLGNSATVHTTLFSGATCPGNGAHSATLSASGTYRLRIRVVQANEIANNYNIDSDTRSGVLFAGALRVGLETVALTAGSYPAGSTFAYTGTEAAVVNYAHSAIASQQTTTAADVASINSGGTAVKTTGVTLSGTSGSASFTVDDTYAASSSSYGASLTIPSSATSALTGVRWTHVATATSPTTVDSEFVAKRTTYYTIDPRITATHLMQNDNTFSTPPMDENDADDTRYGTDLAYVATRFTNARGEGLPTASFAFTSTLRDNALIVPLDTRSQGTGLTIGTQGGQAGWSTLRIFNDGAPTGTWNKAVDVTAPSSIDSDSHLVSGTKTYTVDVPSGGGEGGQGDPLKVFVSPLQAAPGASVRFVASEAFLDGTARTMNAADTDVYLYDPSGDLIVNAGATTELHDGIYVHTHTLASDAEEGAWTVVIETSDPSTMDPVTTSNTFIVGSGADLAASLLDHRERSLELDMHDPTTDFNGLGLDGFIIFAVWLIAFFVMLYMHKVFGAFAAFLGLFDAVTDVLPGSWLGYTLLFILALWLEALVGDKIYQKWLGWKEKNSGRDA